MRLLGFAKSLKSLLGGGLQGLDTGGQVRSGGLFQLHKDEIVNLPKGSAVTPANMATGGQSIKVEGIVRGKDIHFVNAEYDREINNNF